MRAPSKPPGRARPTASPEAGGGPRGRQTGSPRAHPGPPFAAPGHSRAVRHCHRRQNGPAIHRPHRKAKKTQAGEKGERPARFSSFPCAAAAGHRCRSASGVTALRFRTGPRPSRMGPMTLRR
ncbi:unnamed protein product [Amoebophrya sp. A120]|nr:unnamed protein product [Amoebophrya sp. A120]|eukprot:GSA120T00012087001.1